MAVSIATDQSSGDGNQRCRFRIESSRQGRQIFRFDLMGRILDTDSMDVDIGALIWRSDLVAIRESAHRSTWVLLNKSVW